MLLLAIARNCWVKMEKCERLGALSIPWQKKRWSSLTSLQSSYNAAVRRSFLEQFQERAQFSGCSSRSVCFDSPVTTARRGDGIIGKGSMLDVAKGMSVGNAEDCMANGSPTVAPCTFIQPLHSTTWSRRSSQSVDGHLYKGKGQMSIAIENRNDRIWRSFGSVCCSLCRSWLLDHRTAWSARRHETWVETQHVGGTLA